MDFPVGFLGFLGLRYFQSGEAGDLFYLAFFSFFGFYFVGSLSREMTDERLEENDRRARSLGFGIALVFLLLIGMGAAFPFGTREYMVLMSAVGWAAALLAYAVSFYWYETHA